MFACVFSLAGVDVSVSATLMYKGGKTATIVTSSRLTLKNEAEVFGSKGSMILKSPFWSSLELETPEKTHKFDLPDTKLPFNLLNSGQLAHEAQHVRECLQKGLTESPKLTHAETILVAEIMEEIRKQVGVHYPQDDD